MQHYRKAGELVSHVSDYPFSASFMLVTMNSGLLWMLFSQRQFDVKLHLTSVVYPPTSLENLCNPLMGSLLHTHGACEHLVGSDPLADPQTLALTCAPGLPTTRSMLVLTGTE